MSVSWTTSVEGLNTASNEAQNAQESAVTRIPLREAGAGNIVEARNQVSEPATVTQVEAVQNTSLPANPSHIRATTELVDLKSAFLPRIGNDEATFSTLWFSIYNLINSDREVKG